MTDEFKALALALMKTRLNRLEGDTSLDDYFGLRIQATIEALERTGIHLQDTTNDLMLVVDMAVWDYQNRDKPGGMPDWLRLRRRERWISQERGESS